jgi:integrase
MLTAAQLRARWQGADIWLSDGGPRGASRLTARITRDGAALYYQYYDEGDRRRLSLGPYDEKGKQGLTLLQAREKVAEYTRLYRSGITDLHTHHERRVAAEKTAAREEEEAALRAIEEARHGTLQQLMDTYVAHLEHQGKSSARDVRTLFSRHVPAALARARASLLDDDAFMPVIGALVQADKGRTAAKLRAYLRAAYELAFASKSDPTAPQSLRSFGIKSNPLASIRGLSKFNRTRERNLADDELAGYLRGLEPLTEYIRDALNVALYLGGQRPMQLLRLEWADVDLGAAEMTLYDGKGRRAQARAHVLPLTSVPLAILQRRNVLAPYEARVFATAHPSTLTHAVADISAALVHEGIAREPFELRDLRRTAETMLARLKVPKDIRAQIQSHGLGGVQDRHYDRHKYMDEKREALERWAAHLESLKAS